MRIKDLAIGAKVADALGYTFLVAAHDNKDYEGTVLISEKVISIRPMDEPKETYEDAERRKFGSNDYPSTDLHKWLNDDNGFMGELSEELKGKIKTSSVPYSAMEDSVGSFNAKIFIPSVAELGLDVDDHAAEGERLPVFKDFRKRFALPTKDVVEHKPKGFNIVHEGDPWCYWLRTSHPAHSSVQYTCHSHSPYTFFAANRDYIGVRCMLCVDDETEVSEDNGRYRIGTVEGSE